MTSPEPHDPAEPDPAAEPPTTGAAGTAAAPDSLPADEQAADDKAADDKMADDMIADDMIADEAVADEAVIEAAPTKPRRLGLVLMLAAIIVIVDQITKIIAVATIPEGESPSILGGLVYFSLIRNAGAAWSIGTGFTWVLAIVACIVVVVIVRMASKLRSGLWATSLGLILGGALGNLMDRFFRSPGFMRGHVVDFVSVFGPNAEYFPVFNVADSGITIGAILLIVAAVLGIEFDGTNPRKLARQAPAAAAGGSDDRG